MLRAYHMLRATGMNHRPRRSTPFFRERPRWRRPLGPRRAQPPFLPMRTATAASPTTKRRRLPFASRTRRCVSRRPSSSPRPPPRLLESLPCGAQLRRRRTRRRWRRRRKWRTRRWRRRLGRDEDARRDTRCRGWGRYACWAHRAGEVVCDTVGAGVGGCRVDARVLMDVWSQGPTAAFGVCSTLVSRLLPQQAMGGAGWRLRTGEYVRWSR